MTTTPTFWLNETTLSFDTSTFEPHLTALADDTFALSWSAGGDIFGFKLNSFGSFTSGNLLADLSQSTANPLSGAQLIEQTDGSLVTEFRQVVDGDNGDILWHAVGAADPASTFPIEGTGQSFILRDAAATADGRSVVAMETSTDGVRLFTELKFVGANGPTNEGFGLVGIHPDESQINPSIVGLANGNVAIAYENVHPDAAGGPGEHDIRLHVFEDGVGDVADAGGGSHEVLVSGSGHNALLPELALLNGGTPEVVGDDALLVVWQDNNGIEFRRFTDERAIPIDQTPHTITGSAGGLAPHVAALNDGGFMVEWTQRFGFESDGSSDLGIVLQRFDKDGNAVGDQIIIDNPGDQGLFSVDMKTLSDGRVVLAFNNETGDSTDLTTLDYVILDPRDKTINGTDGDDTIVGRLKASVINGLGGADVLTGMNAGDTLSGGAGADTLIGGKGRDTLFGGSDQDTFRFNLTNESKVKAADRIMDFHHGQGDLIDLSNIDADTEQMEHQAFHFIGKHNFHHKAGELHYVKEPHNHVFVEGDVNGDGRADFRIDVHHANHLIAGDFVL
jgi:Ca2+-binding RTX toxin-like protein